MISTNLEPQLGFIVNIYDALNYDIDFPYIDKTTRNSKMLEPVIHNKYSYKHILNNGTLTAESMGTSYRCRLNGIEINNSTYNRKILKQYTTDVKKIIDRVDGWCECYFRGVDVFNRLLIDVKINQININLCEHLLTKSDADANQPYVKYQTRKLKFKNRTIKA